MFESLEVNSGTTQKGFKGVGCGVQVRSTSSDT